MVIYLKFLLVGSLLALTNACSTKSLISPSLAVVGGGVGSLAGPVGAGLGAGAGSMAGSLIANDVSEENLENIIIEKVVDAKLDQAKENGFFDGVLNEIYGVLKLCVIGLGLWFLVPMIYSHYRAKKTEKKWNQTT